jgi:hypothetical protein
MSSSNYFNICKATNFITMEFASLFFDVKHSSTKKGVLASNGGLRERA